MSTRGSLAMLKRIEHGLSRSETYNASLLPTLSSTFKRSQSAMVVIPNFNVQKDNAITQLQDPTVDVHALVATLLDRADLFEVVVSALDKESFARLSDGILAEFPNEASKFETSLANKLLSRLSIYYWRLEYSITSLKECHSAVVLARPALKVLGDSAGFPQGDQLSSIWQYERQRGKKKNKGVRGKSVDLKPFDNLGIPVPSSWEEAQSLAQDLLQDQKSILQYYLEVLQKPGVVTVRNEVTKPEQVGRSAVTDLEPALDEDMNDIFTTSIQVDGGEQINDVDEPSVGAFPIVQPMKAALYFDSVEGFGEWRILIATRADRDLREAKKRDQKLFNIYIKKIKELSNGHFSDDNQKKLTGADVGVPIFEAKMTRDTRLVYQVDCVKEFDSEIERQVLRIFGIYTHAQLERGFWDVVGKQLSGRGKEYRKRCIYRRPPFHPGDNVISPEIFPCSTASVNVEEPVQMLNISDQDKEELHSLLVLEKFVTFSQALLNSILADQDVAHVFQMSAPEQDIVKHAGSCYVLGRSGTGKTTTMLFKMLGIERTWDTIRHDLHEAMSRPRQLFVTQSRVLAEKVEEYYLKLTESHAAAQRTATESVQLGEKNANDRQDRGLVDKDEEEFWGGSLPKHYKDLQDEHFPLFLTFDHLERLLEADLREAALKSDTKDFSLSLTSDSGEAEADPLLLSNDYMSQQRDSFVSYTTFLKAYWPHFPQNITKNLDPALVYAEFMGVIKGSEKALESDKGYLDRETYLGLSHRQQGTFSNRREAVYSLFQAYLKHKRERKEWDAPDRTHNILRGLRRFGLAGQKVDFIYVDEAQDNLLIDALVLRSICRNPEGLFWAGDTAQTISVGSSFRFNDLKAFLYRVEDKARGGGADSPAPPKDFQLTTNYRSHGGIVRCAHEAVRLITKFWPHAIDILAEEKGVVDGLRPVFFSGWDQDTVQGEQFLFGASGNQIEFGAQQCILVRDDAARERLREQVGDIGLILTLYESKGLEFNDVLLYNFFKDSTVDISQWRVVLNALPEEKRRKCPQFDDTKHNGVCRELKFLYVAITRARKNLWIADCSDRGEPMRMLWNAKDLIQNCTAQDDVPRLAMSSSAEEWAHTARILFDHRRYLQAMRCYERASLPREKDVAYAYHLREQARSTPIGRRTTDTARPSAFISAAEAFTHSATVSVVEKLSYYRNAAECFVEAGEFSRAAEAYCLAHKFAESAQHYRKAGNFDEAVNVIQAHSNDGNVAKIADSILQVAKVHYFKEGKLERARNLFESLEDTLEFMDFYGFDIARATLLEKLGRVSEAAELHLSEGNIVKAITLFLRDVSTKTSQRRAQECLLDGLWQNLSFKVILTPGVNLTGTVLDELLKLSLQLRKSATLPEAIQDQIDMFQAITNERFSALQLLGTKFYHVHNDIPSMLLCFSHAFSKNPKIQTLSAAEVASVLEVIVLYTWELQKVAFDRELCNKIPMQRLFAFQPDIASDSFILKPGSFLHNVRSRELRQDDIAAQETDTSTPIIMHLLELSLFTQRTLQEQLRQFVRDVCYTCSEAQAFSLCLAHVIYGVCNKRECRRSHVDSKMLDREWFNHRLRIHFQAILIYHTITPLESTSYRRGKRSFWLASLFQALNPAYYTLGNHNTLNIEMIPEGVRTLGVIKDWIQDSLQYLYPTEAGFLSVVGMLANLAFSFDNHSDAWSYVRRARCIGGNYARPRELLRVNGYEMRYILLDLVDALGSPMSNSISVGFIFIRTICENHLNIDLIFLCQLIDHLIASFIICYRRRVANGLHGSMLPRSWILRYSEDPIAQGKETRLWAILLDKMPDLLNEIYSGSDGYITYEHRARIEYQVRNVFIARICRSLCLLGYNVGNEILRRRVLSAITSLRRPDRQYHYSFQRYIYANNWGDLVKAVRITSPTPFDDLVELKKSALIVGPARPFPGLRLVLYSSEAEIPGLLRQKSTSAVISSLRVEAQPFVPGKKEAAVSDSEDEDDGTDEDHSLASGDEEEGVDTELVLSSLNPEPEHQLPPPPTEDETKAARRISLFYFYFLSRKRAPASAQARNKWFLACKENSAGMRRKYRIMYLGPLPHLLVCLEDAFNYAQQEKNKAKSVWKNNKLRHDTYETALAQVNKTADLVKEVNRFKKALDPTSPSAIHQKQDTQELRRLVSELAQFLSGLPPGIGQGWEWDLKMAVKGIVQSPVLKKPKPDLVVDDDEDYF